MAVPATGTKVGEMPMVVMGTGEEVAATVSVAGSMVCVSIAAGAEVQAETVRRINKTAKEYRRKRCGDKDTLQCALTND